DAPTTGAHPAVHRARGRRDDRRRGDVRRDALSRAGRSRDRRGRGHRRRGRARMVARALCDARRRPRSVTHMTIDNVENERNTDLLATELPNPRLVDTSYIHWLYDESPYGPAVQRNADDEGVRVAHYAMIPQRYRGADGVVPAGFSLNAVVRT